MGANLFLILLIFLVLLAFLYYNGTFIRRHVYRLKMKLIFIQVSDFIPSSILSSILFP